MTDMETTASNVVAGAQSLVHQASDKFQKVPGSSIVIRYIQSSHQNDPVRTAMELFLFLFAVYYLVSPAYSTKKQKNVSLTDQVRCARPSVIDMSGVDAAAGD